MPTLQLLRWLPWLRRAPTFQVWLSLELLEDMRREAGTFPEVETGGVLVGYRVGHDIVLDANVSAGPAARRERFKFEPDGPWQANQVARLYEQSGRVMTYAGDWHTHLTGAARPSDRDRRTAAHIASDPEARLPEPLMVILARHGLHWDAHAFVYAGDGFQAAVLIVQRST